MIKEIREELSVGVVGEAIKLSNLQEEFKIPIS